MGGFSILKVLVFPELIYKYNTILQNYQWRAARWLSSLAPPSAQGVILETWDRVPRQAPCMEWSLLLPLPVSLPLSLCVSQG